MQGNIVDLVAVIRRFVEQAEGGGQSYASTLIINRCCQMEFQQDRDEFAALVAPCGSLA
jgi:hypothetical protein